MNKKFIGVTALTVVAVGGYLYYQHHKAQVDEKLQDIVQDIEEKIQDIAAILAPSAPLAPDLEEDAVTGR